MTDDATATVADALETRPDTLEAFVDDDTTAAEVLGRFGAAPTHLELVEAWLAGEHVEAVPDTAGGPAKTDAHPQGRTPENGENDPENARSAAEPTDSRDTDDDYHVPLDEDTVAEHYQRVRPVYEALATVGDYPTMGLDDLAGWYITRDEIDVEPLQEGYTKRRRPAAFQKDLDTVLERVDRTIYGLTTYKSPAAFRRWRSARLTDAGEYEYREDTNPTPEPEDLRAVCAWGDIDLRDELKGKRGDLDEETRATAEATLDAYVEEFAGLVGGRDAVYALDSVGGAYIFTAPEATAPIAEYVAEEYGERWVGEVMRAVIDRANDYLKAAQERVEDRVDDASDVIDPDWANNHNRKYKAPLAIHGDHDAVVTPLDTDGVDYSVTSLDDVDDDLVAEAEAWADRFTATDHTDRVEDVVAALFDEEYADADGWRGAVDAYVEAEEAEERKRERLRAEREAQKEEREERDLDLSEFDITPRVDDVKDDIDELDTLAVAEDTIADRVTEDEPDLTDRSGTGKKAIVPSWAGSYNSGNATYLHLENGIFNDTDSGDHGTVVEMALIAEESWPVGKIADGRDWSRGVEHLRGLGYEIRVWTPDARTNPNGDTMPYWALRRAAVALGVVEEDDLVPRDSDTGDVVEDPEEHDGDTYLAFPPGKYAEALTAVEEHGLETGREVPEPSDGEERTTGRDLLDLDVVVEPRNALAAAEAVEPTDLERDLPELERDDVDDVAIAVALAEGWIPDADTFPSDGRYTEAYYRARDAYGAPLPKYLDNSTLEQREDLVFAALDRITPEHVLDTCRSDVTVEDPAGTAIAKLNPTWEDSESGERILAGYGRGFYCVEHDVSFSPIQLVALEHDLYPDDLEGSAREHAYPRGEAFKTAYRLLREEYGAPLPKWRATLLEHVAVLPPSVRLLDDDMSARSDGYSLDEAREATEALLRDAVTVRDRGQLVTALPGTGKTYGTAALAADRPVLYITQRNALKQQMEEYVATVCDDEEHHPDAEPTAAHLPILAKDTLPEAALGAGVTAVREHDRDLLRDPDALYQHVADDLEDDRDDEDDEDAVDLNRATCPTADGEHGERWAVRLQVARALGHTPAELHHHATALFGETLPCQHGGECPYSAAWDRISDPANPIDLLIGAPQHARVNSATTYYERAGDGETRTTDRAVVVDEFPGESYFSSYGERYMDHAVWLAEALVDVDNREDLLDAGLETDTWVSRWLDGEGDDVVAVADAIDALEAASAIADAADTATDLRERDATDDVAGDTSASLQRVRAALATVADADPADADALDTARQDLASAVGQLETDADRAYAENRDGAGDLYTLADTLEDLVEDLARGTALVDEDDTADALNTVRERLDAVPAGGDLRGLLDAAVDAVQGEAPDGLLDATTTALRGGREGCRELAIFADDGYAHPSAWVLLAGAIATPDGDGVREVTTGAFTFDRERDGGGRFKRLQRNGATIAADRNHHGAEVVDPPAFTDRDGRKCPVVGLDATGRTTLWRQAIGRDTQRRDIHDTDAERRRFLREAVDLTVIQTTENPLPYHSDPTGKNFQEDLELVETATEAYTGDGDGSLDEKGPAVISTKKVLEHLEDDLDEHAGATVNYENMKGSDALGEHQVLVALGSQHYGDAVPEKWALVAGESAGRGDTRGDTLDYGSDVANAYLKHMREDHTMQAILRAGRNDDTTVAVAHTGALRPDLPVEAEGAVVSAHSRGALAVAEAAAELEGSPFTARDVADELGAGAPIGLRQVQNVLADFREGGYLRVEEQGDHGRAFEYDLEQEPGRADVELPGIGPEDLQAESEISANETYYTWDFVFGGADRGRERGAPPGAPTIPARDTADGVAATVDPPD